MPLLRGFDQDTHGLAPVGRTLTRQRTLTVKETIKGYRCKPCGKQFKDRASIKAHLRRALDSGSPCRAPAPGSCKGCGDGRASKWAACQRCAPLVLYVTEIEDVVPRA